MKLHEIITANEEGKEILIEALLPYRKSLNVLMPNSVLMVTMVSNAVQYGRIVPIEGFSEVLEEYVNSQDDMTEEDKEAEKELINFQSIMLKDL
jgi:hypothetical protein